MTWVAAMIVKLHPGTLEAMFCVIGEVIPVLVTRELACKINASVSLASLVQTVILLIVKPPAVTEVYVSGLLE
jgi:hypothetical protein